MIPNATTPGEEAPAWYEEPARKVAQILGNVLVVLGVLLGTLNELVDGVPERARTYVTAVIGVVVVVVKIVTIVQGQLTRDRVWSPSSIEHTFGDPDYPGGANLTYPAPPGEVLKSGAVERPADEH